MVYEILAINIEAATPLCSAVLDVASLLLTSTDLWMPKDALLLVIRVLFGTKLERVLQVNERPF